MYPYVRAALAFNHMNIEQLREQMNARLEHNVSYQHLTLKLRGGAELTFEQAKAIFNILKPEQDFLTFWKSDKELEEEAKS